MDFLPNDAEIVGNPGKSEKSIDNPLDSGIMVFTRVVFVRDIILRPV
jgi:hypothetical protein